MQEAGFCHPRTNLRWRDFRDCGLGLVAGRRPEWAMSRHRLNLAVGLR